MLQEELTKLWENWKIDKELGEGSFGKVYRIEREDFGHIYEAALKVIRIPESKGELISIMNDGMDEESAKEYFRGIVEDIVEEFVLMSKLKGNTNIVSYEDHAVVSQEEEIGWNIFIRMELLTPLFDYMKQSPLTVRDIINLGIDICNALELCQRFNIIHRDIKPENIFVSEVGRYKLGDFGIARQLEKTSAGLSKKGTYPYMAPEVYKGEEYNSTVDIYSLGIVLYRFLNNNRLPFMPDAPATIRYVDKEKATILRMSGSPMPKPKNADGRLAEIILKACAYNPKDRYESAADMKRALESVLYSDEEVGVVYPKGDGIGNDEFEYSKSQKERTEKSVTLVETAGIEDSEEKTVYIFPEEQQKERRKEEVEVPKPEQEKQEEPKKTEEPTVWIAPEKVMESEKPKQLEKNNATAIRMIIITTVIALISVSGFFLYRKVRYTTVPNLENMLYEDAFELTDSAKVWLELEESKRNYSETVEEGYIISQDIEEGAIVKKGTKINVIVSKGIWTEVPNLINKDIEEAKKMISDSGLWLATPSYEYSDEMEKNHVIRQSASPGVYVEKGHWIYITVSKGKEKPDSFTEQELEEIKTSLKAPKETEVYVGNEYFWEEEGRWLITVECAIGNMIVAYSDVDMETGELVRNTLKYNE